MKWYFGFAHVAVLGALIALASCDEETRKQLAPTTSEEAQTITYVQDARTGFCFVVSHVSEYPFGTANIYNNVPCSPEVEKLIQK